MPNHVIILLNTRRVKIERRLGNEYFLVRIETKKAHWVLFYFYGAGSRTRLERSDNDVLIFVVFCSKNKNGAGSRTRTYEARRREIYSLLSLPLDDSSTKLIIHAKLIFV